MKKAIVVGGSMGGLLAGNMLVREGWSVDVLERTKGGLEARGAGIVPQRSLLAALKACRRHRSYRHRHPRDQAGGLRSIGSGFRHTSLRPVQHVVVAALQPAPRSLPRRALSRRTECRRIAQDQDSAVAILDDGTRFEGDLLIGADGMRSTVRAALFPSSAEICRLPGVAWHAGRTRGDAGIRGKLLRSLEFQLSRRARN